MRIGVDLGGTKIVQPLAGRSFDWWDLAANTAGALIGAVLAAGPLGRVLIRWEAAHAARRVRRG